MTKKIFTLTLVTIILLFVFFYKKNTFKNSHKNLEISETQFLDDSASDLQLDHNNKSNRNYLSPHTENINSKTIGLKTIKDSLALGEKALRTKAENQAYLDSLQNKEMIDFAYTTISNVQEPSTEKDLLVEQKERMDAVLFLTRALEFKNNSEGEYIKNLVKKIILDDSIAKAKDPALKKSLAADRIELFANLKTIDTQAGSEIQKNAVSPISKKIIQFASNFYNLNKKTKGDL